MNVYQISFEHSTMGVWEEVIVAGKSITAIEKAHTKIQKDAQKKGGWELVKVNVLHKDVIVVR